MAKNVNYSPLINRDFVFELAKRGRVSLCSHQITVEGHEIDLDGIVIPPDTHLEYMFVRRGEHENKDVAVLRFVCKVAE